MGTQAENLEDMTRKGRRARFALKGDSAPGCKVTEAAGRAALTRIDAGESASAIAAELGIHRSTIWKIRRRLG